MLRLRKHNGPQAMGNAFLSRVPDALVSRIKSQLSGIARKQNEIVKDFKLRDLQERLKVVNIPDHAVFERYVLQKVVELPQVQIDDNTQRIYLSAAGIPGRFSRYIEERPVKDEADQIVYQLFTQAKERDDLLIVYTEITLATYREAHDVLGELSRAVRSGLCEFFSISPGNLLGVVLTLLMSHTKEEIEQVAFYAMRETQ